MRCHIASLVWADRCLPLSSTIGGSMSEMRRKNEEKRQIDRLHIGVLSR
jgi:hypothetical protein